MDKYGVDLNPHIPRDLQLEFQLIQLVSERYGRLLSDAILHIGKKRNVEIPISEVVGSELCGCRVNYCAKERRFDFIQYPMRGKRGAFYAKRIVI